LKKGEFEEHFDKIAKLGHENFINDVQ